MTEQDHTANQEERNLSRLDVWAIAFGCMVGWGSFVMPGSTFLPVAGPAGTIISMAIGLVITLVIAGCIVHLMQRSAASGGLYIYTKEALGRDHAFLCSWFLCLSYLTIVFLNGTALFLVLRAMLGDSVYRGFSYSIAGRNVYIYEVLLSLIALTGAGFLFLVAKDFMRRLTTVLALILVAGIAVTTAICLPHANLHDIFCTFGYRNVNLGFAIFSLVILAPWAFVGFEVVTFDTSRFKFPVRKAKWVIFSSIIVAALAYTFMTLVSVSIIPDGYKSWPQYIADLDHLNGIVSIPSFYAAKKTMGRFGLAVVGITAIAAILTGIIGAYRAIINLLSTMAEDRILSQKFVKLKYCIFFVMFLSVLVSLVGRNALRWFIDLTAFGAIVAYGYASLAAYRTAKMKNNTRIMILGFLGTVISALFGIAQLVPHLVAMEAMCSEAFLLLALWCLLGFVFYWRAVRRSSLAEYNGIATSGLVLFSLLLYAALLWLGKLLIRQNEIADVRRCLVTGGIVLLLIIFVGLIVMLYIQKRIRDMHEASARERIRLAEGNIARSQFLLHISNDIRTPMDAIVNFTALALKEPDYMLKDYLRKIQRAGGQLQTVLDDILEMSRNEKSVAQQEFTPTDLCLSFEKLKDPVADLLKRKRIAFSVNTSVQNRYAWSDRKDFLQGISDIIVHFCDSAPEGGTVSASLCETGSGTNGYSTYEMRFQNNSGEGVFAQGGTAAGDGAELEPKLAAAKSEIEQAGGNVEIFSSPGKMEIVIRMKFRLASENEMKQEKSAEKVSGR